MPRGSPPLPNGKPSPEHCAAQFATRRTPVRRPTVHAVRVIEAVELVACRVFNLAHQTRQRITFGDVERHLAQLASHPPTVPVGAVCWRPG